MATEYESRSRSPAPSASGNYQTQKSKELPTAEFKKYRTAGAVGTRRIGRRAKGCETRRQRRAARAATGDGAATVAARAHAAGSGLPAARQAADRPADGEAARPVRARVLCRARKVDWPTRNQTFQGVVVVIIACAIAGLYLWGLDQIIRPLVDRVLSVSDTNAADCHIHRGREADAFEDLRATWNRRSPIPVLRSRRRDVPLVRDQHLFRAREQGEDESRAPHRLAEPTAGFAASSS